MCEDLECPICGNDMGTCSAFYITHCGHMYHIDCIKSWLKVKKNCPMCRRKLYYDFSLRNRNRNRNRNRREFSPPSMINLPLLFWFSSDPNLTLPIVSLPNITIEYQTENITNSGNNIITEGSNIGGYQTNSGNNTVISTNNYTNPVMNTELNFS